MALVFRLAIQNFISLGNSSPCSHSHTYIRIGVAFIEAQSMIHFILITMSYVYTALIAERDRISHLSISFPSVFCRLMDLGSDGRESRCHRATFKFLSVSSRTNPALFRLSIKINIIIITPFVISHITAGDIAGRTTRFCIHGMHVGFIPAKLACILNHRVQNWSRILFPSPFSKRCLCYVLSQTAPTYQHS